MIANKLRLFLFTLAQPALLLGGRRLFDPVGQVSPTATPLAADSESSASPAAPEAPDAEVDDNDVRLSYMGRDGSFQYRASNPAIASLPPYFMVLWEGDDNTSPLVNEEIEIFYQVLDTINRLYLPLV